MATVYEALLERKTTKQLGKELTSIMNVKLTQLLKTTCNIDLSIVKSPFLQRQIVAPLHEPIEDPKFSVFSDGVIVVSFYFENGMATVTLFPKRKLLTVSFHFTKLSSDFIFPYNAKDCFVTVDNDMNFMELEFRVNFCLFTSTLEGIAPKASNHTSSMVSIQVIQDNKGVITKQFIYGNSDTKFLKKLSDHGLDPLFMNSDENFNNLLFSFMKAHSEKPAIFYDTFKEYTSYQELMVSVDSMVYFMNMFAEQYNHDLYLLKSRLMLFEMSNI